MTHFLQNNWPTSSYQIVSGFWLQRIFCSNSELPGTNERMCRRICSSKTSALHGFPPHSLHGLSGRTHLHPQILYATCLCTKILFVLTAVMSNDVGAAAEYLSTPRPIIGWHHLLLLHLKTECNTMWNRAWAHASKLVANGPRNGGPFPEGRSCALDRRCTILSNRRPSSHE